jgi:hypothetical protein
VPLLLVAAVVLYGTIGFPLIESASLLDAFYQTVPVLSTIGTGTPEPCGDGAEIFTITLILVGVAAVFSGIGVGTAVLVSGEFAHGRVDPRGQTPRLGAHPRPGPRPAARPRRPDPERRLERHTQPHVGVGAPRAALWPRHAGLFRTVARVNQRRGHG